MESHCAFAILLAGFAPENCRPLIWSRKTSAVLTGNRGFCHKNSRAGFCCHFRNKIAKKLLIENL